jgi:superfamily II RNA helicase
MKFKNFELDTFQIEAIKHIEENKSVVVSAATGCGKTLIADYIIDKYIKENKRVIYTAPIKALSNQKYKDFKNDYGEDKVGILTGDVSINHTAQILIMTTEIYRNMLITKESAFTDVSYVIFDEIHFISDIERGVVWEESIIFSPNHIRFLCLSATVPNALEFAEWISKIKNHPVEVVKNPKRVVPLEHYVYTTQDGIITMQKAKEIIDYEKKYLYGAKRKEARQIDIKDHQFAHRRLIPELRSKDALPCIFFVFSRNLCEAKALDLEKKNDFLGQKEKQEIFEYLNEKISDDIRDFQSVKMIRRLVSKGIGVHHAGLLPILKDIVEHFFSKGYIKVLFATETFAVGINMPARTVVFNSNEKYDGINFRYLNSKEYFQLAGRAGRRGIDKFGRVISIIEKTYVDIDRLIRISTKDTEPIRSQFKLSINSVLNLLKNHNHKEIEEILKLNFSHYLETKKNKKTYFIHEFKNKVNMLKEFGYILNETVTDKGDFASNIYSNEIAITELFYTDLWRQFSKKEILILIAAIIHESRRAESFDKEGITPAYNKIMSIINQNEILAENFDRANLKKMIKILSKWYDGCTFEDMMTLTNILEGDIIRMFRQVIDYCRQVKRATKDLELDEFLSQAMNAIDRDIVKVQL